MTNILSSAESAVKLATKKGFDEVEVFTTRTVRSEIVYGDKIEATKTNEGEGLSVRGILGRRIGFFSVSSLEPRDIEYAIDESLKIARANSEDPNWKCLTRKFGKAHVEGVVDSKIEQLSPKNLVDEVRLVLDTVHEVDKSLKVTRGYISAGVLSNAIANSHGCRLERKETLAASWISVKSGSTRDEKEVSHEVSVSRKWRGLENESLARKVCSRALKMVRAKQIPSGKVNTVWRNDAFGNMIDSMLTRTITADAVQENSRLVRDVAQQETSASRGES